LKEGKGFVSVEAGMSFDKIAETYRKTHHPLLNDNINQALLIEFMKFEEQKDTNPKKRRPSLRELAKKLYKNGITRHEYKPSGIKKRVDKLIEAGLIDAPYAERRRKARERSWEDQYLNDLENQADI